jgi:histidine ammonia-lyase
MTKRITRANSIVIKHDKPVSLEDILSVALQKQRVTLAKAAKEILADRRRDLMDFVQQPGNTLYGINTGFGRNVDLAISPNDLATLQRNLILSHSAGMGDPVGEDITRITMLLRARSLARGHSGVRPVVVETILDCLNAGIIPVVPKIGSVSASGDLAPLSHIALGLIGEGDVHYKGKIVPAREALNAEKIEPLVLEAKEGLALNNGAQYANALGIYGWHKMSQLLHSAYLATAMSAQVMLGADTPYEADLHALRPHSGAQKAAHIIHKLMQDSPIRESHRKIQVDGEVQDPYSLRCAAQILGSCQELLDRAAKTFEIEANSVTDNPVILPNNEGKFSRVVSGGHFHGMPVANDLHGLVQAAGIMASLTNARCQRYVDGNRNKGLGSYMMWPGSTDDSAHKAQQSVSSGMMIPEYTTAGMLNSIWGASMPSHLMSVSTSAGQEDHVSMAANVGLRLRDIVPQLAGIIAIEFAFIGQAAAIRKEMNWIPTKAAEPDPQLGPGKHAWGESERKLNPVGEEVLSRIYSVFPPVKEDRYMAGQLEKLSTRVLSGELIDGIDELKQPRTKPSIRLVNDKKHGL